MVRSSHSAHRGFQQKDHTNPRYIQRQHNIRTECKQPRIPHLICNIHGQTYPLDLMHHCLNVDEIVRLIACELVASGREATAVRLARCCKSFEDPVLDTLWAMQVELFPLFKCFPGDVWDEGGYTVSTPTTRLFFFPQQFGSKVFQTAPDSERMGSIPEVRSKNARTQ